MSLAGSNTFLSLNGMFKEVYADKIEDLVPEGVKLYTAIKFNSKEKAPGNLYHQMVSLGLEHGITFAASDDDAFALQAAINSNSKDAQVRGNSAVLRSVLGYAAAARALGGDKKAFMDATKYLVKNMLKSFIRKLEAELMYGQVGYGTVAGTYSTASATLIPITTAEWAPGIWAGSENMPIEVRSADGTTSRGTASITAVDIAGRTITVGSGLTGVIAGDVIWHMGAYGVEFAGLHKIMTNTGTLFNISASSYSLWKANTYAVGSTALSLSAVENGITLAVAKGLEEDVTLLVHPRTWANLMAERDALRRYDQSYSTEKQVAGSKAIEFHTQTGIIKVVPSTFCKEGYAYLFVEADCVRVGSTEVTFKRPGAEGNFFRDVENSAGYELRAYTDQALFTAAPGKMVLYTGIVNS